jgi:hypothetical protein
MELHFSQLFIARMALSQVDSIQISRGEILRREEERWNKSIETLP